MADSKNIGPKPDAMSMDTSDPTVWISANFAGSWYRDAQHEAEGSDEHAVRREILFSACYLETYILEWVRSIKINLVTTYFPPGKTRSLKAKWEKIPRQLHADGVVSRRTSLDLSELGTLISYRNGLVHARASRPSTSDQPHDHKPVPPIDKLKEIPHGWAIGVATTLVRELHLGLGSEPPDYLK